MKWSHKIVGTAIMLIVFLFLHLCNYYNGFEFTLFLIIAWCAREGFMKEIKKELGDENRKKND